MRCTDSRADHTAVDSGSMLRDPPSRTLNPCHRLWRQVAVAKVATVWLHLLRVQKLSLSSPQTQPWARPHGGTPPCRQAVRGSCCWHTRLHSCCAALYTATCAAAPRAVQCLYETCQAEVFLRLGTLQTAKQHKHRHCQRDCLLTHRYLSTVMDNAGGAGSAVTACTPCCKPTQCAHLNSLSDGGGHIPRGSHPSATVQPATQV